MAAFLQKSHCPALCQSSWDYRTSTQWPSMNWPTTLDLCFLMIVLSCTRYCPVSTQH